MTYDVEYLFICLFAICISSLVRCLLRFLVLFFFLTRFFVFLLLYILFLQVKDPPRSYLLRILFALYFSWISWGIVWDHFPSAWQTSFNIFLSMMCWQEIHPFLVSEDTYFAFIVKGHFHCVIEFSWEVKQLIFTVYIFYTIFKGYTAFSVITKYWLYSSCRTMRPCSLSYTQ